MNEITVDPQEVEVWLSFKSGWHKMGGFIVTIQGVKFSFVPYGQKHPKVLIYELSSGAKFVEIRNKEGKYSLTFTKFRNKKTKLENIKFSDTGALFFDGSSVTSLGIYDFATFDDFYKEIDRLNASWTRAKGVPAE